MAQASTVRGTQLLIKVGDGASPEVFTHPCLVNTERGIQWQSQGSDVIVPDCSDPDLPAFLEHVKDGLSATINGAGTLNTPDIADFDEWFRSPEAKNVQVWVGSIGYWQGAFHLTEWSITGTRSEKAQCALTLRSEGTVPAFIPQP